MIKRIKTQLLCTFTKEIYLEKILNQIKEIYLVKDNKILVIENVEDINELYCIYNIEKRLNQSQLKNTILIHRKRGFNILYTINSLNYLIWLLNNGEKNKDFIIPWENYKNTFLLIKNKELSIIKTKLKTIHKF